MNRHELRVVVAATLMGDGAVPDSVCYENFLTRADELIAANDALYPQTVEKPRVETKQQNKR